MAYRALSGRFAEPEVEQRYAIEERRARLPFVRAYAAVAAAVVLAYTILNPFFFTLVDDVRFMMLVVPTLVLLAGYFAATFWSGYPRHPAIDFLCLFLLALLILGDDELLRTELQRLAPTRHSAIAIDPLIVSAFAAFALVGHSRWFVAWLACHAAVSLTGVMMLESNAAPRRRSPSPMP